MNALLYAASNNVPPPPSSNLPLTGLNLVSLAALAMLIITVGYLARLYSKRGDHGAQ